MAVRSGQISVVAFQGMSSHFMRRIPSTGPSSPGLDKHRVENGFGGIHTNWLHATDVKEREEHEWMWYSNRIGSDIFTGV